MDEATHARWLFGAAAAFNVAAVVQMLVVPAPRGEHATFLAVAAALVATFGYAYLRVALDHRAWRPYVELGIVAKSLAVVGLVAAWAVGDAGDRILLLAAADAVFAALFVRFLRRTR